MKYGTSRSSTAASSTVPAGRASTPAQGGWIQRQRRPEPDTFARRRRRHHAACPRQPGRPGHPGRPFLRWCGHHRGRHSRECRRPRLHRRVRARSGRVGQQADRTLPPGAPVPPILPPQDGFLFLDRDKFATAFAADSPRRVAAFMADSQVPWGVEALGGDITEPAWRSKPSWYLIPTDDHMIPPLHSARWPSGSARL